jgi:hypothetical protein
MSAIPSELTARNELKPVTVFHRGVASLTREVAPVTRRLSYSPVFCGVSVMPTLDAI